jgi:hypothetical protein
VMPWFFARLGVKWMLLVGMASWGVRYLLFVLGYNTGGLWPLYLGIILHGVCYDFFFVTAYIYTEKKAWDAIRAKAQGFIALVTLGAGMFVGTTLSGKVAGAYSFPAVEPAKFQKVDATAWVAGNYAKWDVEGKPAYGRITTIAGVDATLTVFKAGTGGAFQASDETARVATTALVKPLPRWDSIWLIPGIGALAIMLLFAVIFQYREDPKPQPTH